MQVIYSGMAHETRLKISASVFAVSATGFSVWTSQITTSIVVLYTRVFRVVFHVQYVCVGVSGSAFSLYLLEVGRLVTLPAKVCKCFATRCINIRHFSFYLHLQEVFKGCNGCDETISTCWDTWASQSFTHWGGSSLLEGVRYDLQERYY